MSPLETLHGWGLLLLCLGGSLGASLRFALGRAAGCYSQRWPFATLLTNALGSFVLGLLTGYWNYESLSAAFYFWELGVLGAFTTFATFSLESIRLIQQSRWYSAVGYALSSVFISILLLALGYTLGALIL